MLAYIASQSRFNRVCHLIHIVIALTASLAAMPTFVSVVFVVRATFLANGSLRRVWRCVALFSANVATKVYFWFWHVIIPIGLMPLATKAAFICAK